MSNAFFVVLPSNTKSYRNNKPNKFRVCLPHKITFDGTWSCGLQYVLC